MRKITLLLFFIMACFAPANAQVYWHWSQSCGESDSDKANDVAVDGNGDVYVGGFYNGTGIFGNDTVSSGMGSKEAYIAKYDSLGNFIWVQHCVSGLDDRTLGVHTTPTGDVMITGTFWSYASFSNQNVGSGSADQSFVAKYDAAGNLIWVRDSQGQGDDHAFDVVTDKKGDHYVTGFFSTHYGPIPSNAGFAGLGTVPIYDSIAYVAKLSASGTWLWYRLFGGNDVERDNGIAIDSSGNVYIAGGFYRTRTFGSQTVTSHINSRDIFVCKYDSTGNFQWLQTAGSNYDDRANDIVIDKAQNLYITGEFRDEVAFGTDTINNHGGPGGRDIFVAKLTNSGQWTWAKRAGANSGGDRGNAIATDNRGRLFVTGQIRGGNVYFGNDTTIACNPADTLQVFAACIDTTGDWKWAIQAGGDDEDRGNGIAFDTTGCRIYVAGFYDAPGATFSSNYVNGHGRKDGFVARISGGCYPLEDDPGPVDPPPPSECIPEIPNVFTPNGDNINDKFTVINGTCVTDFEWRIFNRWGQVVYNTTNPNKMWDGYSTDGQLLSDGVYYYAWKAILQNGETVERKGFVHLVR